MRTKFESLQTIGIFLTKAHALENGVGDEAKAEAQKGMAGWSVPASGSMRCVRNNTFPQTRSRSGVVGVKRRQAEFVVSLHTPLQNISRDHLLRH